MSFPVAVIAGIGPMLVYTAILYWFDRYDREPLGLVIAVIVWGFVPAAVLSLIFQLIADVPLFLLDESGSLGDVVTTILVAPLTEEFFKGLAVLAVFLLWHNEFDDVFDGILYGGLVGFGFSAIENILYYVGAAPGTFLLRGVIFGLNHAFFTSLTGIGFGVARNARSGLLRFSAPLIGLIAAMAAHMLHNVIATFASGAPGLICLAALADWAGVLFVFVVMLLALRRERQWLVEELRDEIGLNTLTAEQYAVVCSPVRRVTARLAALFTAGPVAYWRVGGYYHALTELAFKKNEHRQRGEAGATAALIDRLRAKATAGSAEFSSLA